MKTDLKGYKVWTEEGHSSFNVLAHDIQEAIRLVTKEGSPVLRIEYHCNFDFISDVPVPVTETVKPTARQYLK